MAVRDGVIVNGILADSEEEVMGINDRKQLAEAERPMLILGTGAVSRRDGLVIMQLCQDIADKYGLINAEWNGFNVLNRVASRVGAMDLGLTTQKGVEGLTCPQYPDKAAQSHAVPQVSDKQPQ